MNYPLNNNIDSKVAQLADHEEEKEEEDAVDATATASREAVAAQGPAAEGTSRPVPSSLLRSSRQPVFPVVEAASSKRENGGNGEQSMTRALFVSWILPVLLLALVSRFTVHLEAEPDLLAAAPKSRSVPIRFDESAATNHNAREKQQPRREETSPRASPSSMSPSSAPTSSLLSKQPANYRALVRTIDKRRRRVGRFTSSPGRMQEPGHHFTDEEGGPSRPRGGRGPDARDDPERRKLKQRIAELEKRYEKKSSDLFRAIDLADAYRMYEVQYHDGGLHEADALRMYEVVTQRVEDMRSDAIRRQQDDLSSSQGAEASGKGRGIVRTRNVYDEMTAPYPDKSLDGLLCAVYTGQGKALYMANMFSKSVDSYSRCLQVDPEYLDAIDARASSYIVLGNYEEAAADSRAVIERDQDRLLFSQAYTGLARVLEARENVASGGWDWVVDRLRSVLPDLEAKLDMYPQGKTVLAPTLNRLHHVMFTYHDVKTKDYAEAFGHLTKAFEYKMSVLPPWPKGIDALKVQQTKQIFKEGFWPEGIGNPTRVPVFIVGFVRSGSTLLERVLDAHPLIVGTGENSVFNGRLDDIRNRIVEVSSGDRPELLGPVTLQLAEEVVGEMKRRWQVLEANTDKPADEVKVNPQRFVDKMLTNYYNIGFIHLLYPNALILHVAREPMDTIFSAYKHEFPPGTLDYTSDFEALAELYHAYRDLMEHWDQVLPGRVTHVRYQDMVHDMPGVARAIINATGLPWDESVLNFHKKKHAVNTLSSTQVRKGVYKDSLKAWMRYKDHLSPLLKLIGDRVDFEMKTTLPTYQPPPDFENNERTPGSKSVRIEKEDVAPTSIRIGEATSSDAESASSSDVVDQVEIHDNDEL